LYGKAGAHRIKSYGVEYRTLSSFWVHDVAFMRWVYKQAMLAVASVDKVETIHAIYGVDTIINCINNSDKDVADYLVHELNIKLP
jgi:uncharacterized protein with PhoU and TrkA domain